MKKSRILLSVVLTWFVGVLGEDNSIYNHQDDWPPKCHEKNQSPINIKPKDAVFKDYGDVKCENYLIPFEATLTNDGSALFLELSNPPKIPTISKGPLDSLYLLSRVYFHWPSEHTINGIHSVLEIHLIHYAEKYGNLTNAQTKPDGIVIAAVISRVTQEDNKAIKSIVDVVDQVQTKINQPVPLKQSIVLRDLLPENFSPNYFYKGTVVVPPCNPLLWIIMKHHGSISVKQWHRLKDIRDKNDKVITSNIRKTQPLDGRTVYTNTKK